MAILKTNTVSGIGTEGTVFEGDITFDSLNYMTLPKGTTTERFWNYAGVPAASARGVSGGGYTGSAYVNNIQYITISTTGNAADFGDLVTPTMGMAPMASPTRGVWAGGYQPGGDVNSIQYITIASTGNAQDFGDQSSKRQTGAGFSNSIRGCFSGSTYSTDNNSNTIGLYEERISQAWNNSTSTWDVVTTPTSSEIGVARVYSLGLRNTPYSATEGAGSEWNLYLYDIQTYTKLTLNLALAAHDCPVSTFVRGVSSGASGYVKSVNGSDVTISQTSGTFITGEKILINETDEHSRSISSFVTYGVDDIKSVYQNSSAFAGLNVNFLANTVLKEVSIFSQGTTIEVVTTSSMSGTIESFGNTFNKVKAKSIVKYQAKDFEKFSTSPNFNKVDSISPDLKTLNVLGVSTAIGVCTGFVGVATGSANGVAVSDGSTISHSYPYTLISNRPQTWEVGKSIVFTLYYRDVRSDGLVKDWAAMSTLTDAFNDMCSIDITLELL